MELSSRSVHDSAAKISSHKGILKKYGRSGEWTVAGGKGPFDKHVIFTESQIGGW